jgi:hypothetical protein
MKITAGKRQYNKDGQITAHDRERSFFIGKL